MEESALPMIHELDYNHQSIEKFREEMTNEAGIREKFFLNYPTVYIISDKHKKQQFSIYIGESTNIHRRTVEHLTRDPKTRTDWKALSKSKTANMFVIGHPHFNKSLTLDIENKLMLYMSSMEGTKKIYNRRNNPQNDYYTSHELDAIFSSIWTELRKKNKDLFPLESLIRDSAIFKASPFHKLTEEQVDATDRIILRTMEVLSRNKSGQLILVDGEAGTGKTVLMSSLFYELYQMSKGEIENPVIKDSNIFLLVNHDEQLKVYQQIAKRLGMKSNTKVNLVNKPATFIHKHSPEEPVDVVIVDEAHLLLTQGNQGYSGKNQLKDLLERAKVVIAVFDAKQILGTEQYWEADELAMLTHGAQLEKNYIQLENQLRINADKETIAWIRGMIDKQEIADIPKDSQKYDLKIFDSPEKLHKAIKRVAKNQDSGLSRVVATFDWPYVNAKSPEDSDYWRVQIGDWSLPWNLQLPGTNKNSKELPWAEQEQTIDEAGSTYTIQGFDLNYVGVIIGPSVKYRNGEIVFDREASKNRKATQKRTLKDGTKEHFSDMFLRNELNVLLTRGVNGLYIYAVDKELREALLKAYKGRK